MHVNFDTKFWAYTMILSQKVVQCSYINWFKCFKISHALNVESSCIKQWHFLLLLLLYSKCMIVSLLIMYAKCIVIICIRVQCNVNYNYSWSNAIQWGLHQTHNYSICLHHVTLTILQCLPYEWWWTVWSSTSIIDCCHLYRVVSKWGQSSQHMLSAPLSCSVHNGSTIAVAQSVSSDGSSLLWAGYCSPHYTQWPALHWCAFESFRSTSRGWGGDIHACCSYNQGFMCCMYIPVDVMFVIEVTLLLIKLVLNTAITLTKQTLPGDAACINLWVVVVPSTELLIWCATDELHIRWQE